MDQVRALAVQQLEALVDVVFDVADRAELERWLAQNNQVGNDG